MNGGKKKLKRMTVVVGEGAREMPEDNSDTF